MKLLLVLLALGILGANGRFTIERNDLNTLPEVDVDRKVGGLFRKLMTKEDLNVDPDDPHDPGLPLFITPLLKQKKYKEARQLARVSMGHRHGHSYAGYFTVNENYNSNLYFWLFTARERHQEAPVIVWLQGGPGGSSLFGLFTENGPFTVTDNMQLQARNYSWNDKYHVLYIDNPVGTGFSFTDSDEGYATNEADVGLDLYNMMTQFYQVFPELVKNKLYITGESYAGKYVPALTYTIHKMNPSAQIKMNLHGMAIGDGLCDPVSMTNYGDFLYQIGMLDQQGRQIFKKEETKMVNYIMKKQYKKAFQTFDTLMNGDLTTDPSIFYNLTGWTNYFNYISDLPKDMNDWEKFINLAKTRLEIHVGNKTFHSGIKVEQFLMNDVMQTVKPWIEEIANNYNVLFYNGQLDIIIAYPLTENFLSTLQWKHSKEFQNAKRIIWKVDGEVAGYVKEAPNFAFVLVRNAGHMVPFDQPKWALDMLSRFTKYT